LTGLFAPTRLKKHTLFKAYESGNFYSPYQLAQVESIVRGMKEVGTQARTKPEETNSLCAALKL